MKNRLRKNNNLNKHKNGGAAKDTVRLAFNGREKFQFYNQLQKWKLTKQQDGEIRTKKRKEKSPECMPKSWWYKNWSYNNSEIDWKYSWCMDNNHTHFPIAEFLILQVSAIIVEEGSDAVLVAAVVTFI